MPFNSYATLSDVARKHPIRPRWLEFLVPVSGGVSETFRSELAFTMRELPIESSESTVCESLIYPMLREVWKPYRESLMLWGHEPIRYDDDLSGVPDFLVAERTVLGPFGMGPPYLLIVEAKKDDFTRGWAQCLAAMIAAQKINNTPDRTIYGGSTNGQGWQFGHLQGDAFTRDPRLFSIKDLDGLAGALHFLLSACRDQLTPQPASA